MCAYRTAAGDRPLSIEEFEQLPDEEYRTELVRGLVVREPLAGYEHGHLAWRIGFLLGRYVEEHRLGRVLAAETGFILARDPPTVRGPDAAFVAADRIPPEGIPKGYAPFAPDLTVEVVSPSNRPSELQEKVLDYLDAGTRLVWVIEPRTRSVTAYRSRQQIRLLRENDELDGDDVLPGFRLPVSEIFKD